MTTETMAEAPESADETAVQPYVPESDEAARAHLFASLMFLGVSLVFGLVLAVQLVEPDFLSGRSVLSYGRLQPTATHLFLYGWVTIGLIGAAYYVLPRVTGGPLASQAQARGALSLLTLGYVVGAAGIVFGSSEGRRLLEAPLWADVIVLLGLLGVARVITVTVRQCSRLGPVHWYLLAASWWLVMLHVVGNIPGLTGVSSALQTSFYRAGLTGMWVAAAGVGIVYYLVPRLTGRDALVPTQLSIIGLWSLGFVWILTAPSELTYGPAPDWLDTVSVIFALSLAIPVAAILADIVIGMRGRWGTVTDITAMRYVMVGAVALSLVPLVNLLLALRGSSSIVGLTDWFGAMEFLATGVAATFFLLGYVSVAAPDLGLGAAPSTAWPYRVTILGATLVIAGLLVGGAQAGLTWLGAANSPAFASTGEGFRATVDPLDAIYVLRLAGYAIYAYGLVWFALSILRRSPSTAEAVSGEQVEAVGTDPELLLRRPIKQRGLLGGAVGVFGVGVLLVLVLPSLENVQAEPSILADASRDYDADTPVSSGREVYVREGCQVCHTQIVRPIISDVGLGRVSQPGDYAHETPVLFGTRRIGPDLMHASRSLVASLAEDLAGPDGDPTDPAILQQAEDQVATFVVSHLSDPREERPWSTMPSYDYLSDRDLADLAAYIVALD